MQTLPASDLNEPTQIVSASCSHLQTLTPRQLECQRRVEELRVVRSGGCLRFGPRSLGDGFGWETLECEEFYEEENESITARDHPEINGARSLRRGFEQMHIYQSKLLAQFSRKGFQSLRSAELVSSGLHRRCRETHKTQRTPGRTPTPSAWETSEHPAVMPGGRERFRKEKTKR